MDTKDFSYKTLLVYLLTMVYSRHSTWYTIQEVQIICNEIVQKAKSSDDERCYEEFTYFLETYKNVILRKLTQEQYTEIFKGIFKEE